MPEVLEKVKFLRDTCTKLNVRKGGISVEEGKEGHLPIFDIQVDGGIDLHTAPLCVEAGANVLVSGTYLYGSKDMKQAIASLRSK